MGQAKGQNAYPGARQLLDRALESERGIVAELPSYAAAFKTRMNCYTVRKRERELSMKMYVYDHPKFNTSPYDELVLLIEGNKLKIMKTETIDIKVEDL